MTLEEEVRELAKFAKAASVKLAQATTEERNGALLAMAAGLRAQAPAIVEANGEDMEAARAAGTTEALLDRLMLDEGRIEGMAAALEDLASSPWPTLWRRWRRCPIRSASCRWNRPSTTASSFGACQCPSAWWPWSTRPGPT